MVSTLATATAALAVSTTTATAMATAATDTATTTSNCNNTIVKYNSDGIFLLENGVALIMWVGRAANRALVHSLFGVPTLEGIDTSSVLLRPAEPGASPNDACLRVNAVIAALREERTATWLQLMVVGEGDGQNEHR
jgi:hypothetical protein